MLERFKLTYDMHLWVRCASWVVLVGGAGMFFKVSGGFPPLAWRLLASTVLQIGRLWELRGTAIVLPLAIVGIQSLACLIVWGLFAWGYLAVIRHWWHNESERRAFARSVHEALEQREQWQMAQQHKPQFRTPSFDNLPPFPNVMGTEQASLTHQTNQTIPANPISPVGPIGQISQTSPAGQRSPMHQVGQVGQVKQANQVDTESTDHLTNPLQWQRKLQLRLEIGSGWDVGIKRKRQPNEDSVVALQGTCIFNNTLLPFGLFVVADGMGGHEAGQDASFLAVQAMLQWVVPNIAGVNAMSDELLTALLVDGVQQANLAVYEHGQEIGAEMGTTLTAALVMDSKAYVVNVGDSRTYLHRESVGLRQVTHDHSLVARLVAAGRITPDEIYTHPDRNQVYRGLGEKRKVEVDSFLLTLQANDRLLLCSDGLWEMVRDPEIEKILRCAEWSPFQASKALVRAALKGGGLDNISAIVAHVVPVTA
jgi:serine/threonine protein phosphatase PrpC